MKVWWGCPKRQPFFCGDARFLVERKTSDFIFRWETGGQPQRGVAPLSLPRTSRGFLFSTFPERKFRNQMGFRLGAHGLSLGTNKLISMAGFGIESTSTDGFFQHPSALIDEGVVIGRGTRVWAFAHIVSGAAIGEECNICDHTFVEGGVSIGDRVTIKCGVSLWEGMTVENDVFIGPDAVFTNDARPRSRRHPKIFAKCLLKEGCSIGANSAILPGLVIGRWSMVGAGAVVTRNVPDYALVFGNPARLKGWVCRCGEKLRRAEGSGWSCDCGLVYEAHPNEASREAGLVPVQGA
jgi:UDP-2-acetamido-3-amino-2,3-dideoxy-glucuronate N-acetyltransferase